MSKEILQTKPSDNELQSGRNVDGSQTPEQITEVVQLDRTEIRPRNLSSGSTEIVLQRHGKYERNTESDIVGSLTPEAIALETESAESYFTELIKSTPEAERAGLNILFVASDTSYGGGGQRSYETASIAQRVAERFFDENGIPAENILNITPDLENQPMVIPELREPQFFDETPDFFLYLRDKYGGLGPDFWKAFEEDTEKDMRVSMGAEGPDEITDRLKYAVNLLATYGQSFHQDNPDARLVVWAGTHYDTISPFVKRDILNKDKSASVMVDYGGGVVIDIDAEGVATTTIGEKSYQIQL